MKRTKAGCGRGTFAVGMAALFLLCGSCGYRFVGAGGLPAGMPCVSLEVVRNDTWQPGIDLVFRRDLEMALARRGLECGEGGEGGRVGCILHELELRPALLDAEPGGKSSFAVYRMSVVLEAWIDHEGKRVWTSGLLPVEGEFPVVETAPGEAGLERNQDIGRLWSRLSPEVASRVVSLVSSDM